MTTTATFEAMTRDDRWLGFGYLGERRNALTSTDPEAPAQPLLVEAVDKRVLDYADSNGWTAEDLFHWANSKAGRHFADEMFGGAGRLDERFDRAVRWHLLDRQPAE